MKIADILYLQSVKYIIIEHEVKIYGMWINITEYNNKAEILDLIKAIWSAVLLTFTGVLMATLGIIVK